MNSQDGIATAGRRFWFGLLVGSLSFPLHAQQGQLTDVAIQGFVYEPQRLPPADARIQSLFALDTKLDLPDGFNRQALLKAMQGHVLAKGELVGLFQAPQ